MTITPPYVKLSNGDVIIFERLGPKITAVLLDSENALKEINTSVGDIYKIVGGIMVGSDKEPLKKEIDSRINVLKLRIKSIEEQEKVIGEKAKKIQKEVVEQLGNK